MSSQSSHDAPVRVKDETIEEEGLFGEEYDDKQADEDQHESEDDGSEDAIEQNLVWKDGPFRIKQVAPLVTEEVAVIHLYEQIKLNNIKLDPEYQRDVVWGADRSSSLIKSLMEGYFVPPVIFNSTTVIGEDGQPRNLKVCVDGKQRLSSIVKFINGDIPVPDIKFNKWYYDHPLLPNGTRKTSSGHKILPERSRRKFRQSFLICHDFNNLDAVTEEEMFALVQKGMPLTAAERLKAKSSAWAEFARQYESDYALVLGMAFSKSKRAAEFRAILEIFATILEVENPSAVRTKKNQDHIMSNAKPQLKNTGQQLENLIANPNLLDAKSKADFKRVFDHYRRLVIQQSTPVKKSPKYPYGYKLKDNGAFTPAPEFLIGAAAPGRLKTFSPLEFLAVAVLLYVHGETRTDFMLVDDIKYMRRYLREKNPLDLRMNSTCWKDAWNYIEFDMVRSRGGADVIAARNRGDRLPPHVQNDTANESSDEGAAPVQTSTHPKRVIRSVPSTSNGRAKAVPTVLDRLSSPDDGSDDDLPIHPTAKSRVKTVQFAPDVAAARNNTIYFAPTAQMTTVDDESSSDEEVIPNRAVKSSAKSVQFTKRQLPTHEQQMIIRPAKRSKKTDSPPSAHKTVDEPEVISLDESEDEESSDLALNAWLTRASKNLPDMSISPVKEPAPNGLRGHNLARRGVPHGRRGGRTAKSNVI